MGIKINVEEVLAGAERRRLDPGPGPQIKLRGQTNPLPVRTTKEKQPDPILWDLWDKMTVVKKERAKLSTQLSHLVDHLEEELTKKEGPTVAGEFLQGNIPMPELVKQYGQIQSYTDEAIALYDKIKYVEKYGQLPGEEPVGSVVQMYAPDVSLLQLELNRLKDLIHKTKKKISLGKAKNPLRIQEWHEKLALAEARRDDVRSKIKKLQYDARG